MAVVKIKCRLADARSDRETRLTSSGILSAARPARIDALPGGAVARGDIASGAPMQ